MAKFFTLLSWCIFVLFNRISHTISLDTGLDCINIDAGE